jgi:hypothetical protein
MEITDDRSLAWSIDRTWKSAFDGFFHMSAHAQHRMFSRGLSPDLVEAVLTHGEVFHDRGALHFRVGRRVTKELKKRGIDAQRLEGLHVIVSDDGLILTVYRNHQFRRPRKTHRLDRGPKYRA